MHNFELHTHPFSFRVHTNTDILYQRLTQLYPQDVLTPLQPESFIDFTVDCSRRWNGWQRPYNFRLGAEHFRMADDHDLVPCFEWGMNWCIANFQSYYLCIHAGVLEKDGVCLIMPAPPGSGKSTLCALLMLSGWRLLSDEHCLIDPVSGNIEPCLRPISLKNNSIPVIKRLFGEDTVLAVSDNTFKGTVGYLPPSLASWQRRTEQVKPCYVIFPKYLQQTSDMVVARLPQTQVFMHLAVNSFNYQTMGTKGFTIMSRLVHQIEGLQLEYHHNHEALAFLDSLP